MTTNLPAVATIEAEALQYAKGRLIEFRDNSAQWLGPVGPGHSFLNPEAGHAMVRGILKHLAQWPSDMLKILATARAGNGDAQDAMLELANEYHHRGQTLPVPLGNFQMEMNAGLLQRLPARQKASNYLRNMAFAIITAELYDRFGLKPTRNRQSRSPSRRRSGCATLAEALKLVEMPKGFFKPGEKALEEIWRQWHHLHHLIDPRRLAPTPATAS